MDTLLQTQLPLVVTLGVTFLLAAIAFAGWRKALRLQVEQASSAHLGDQVQELEAELEELEATHLQAEKTLSALQQQLTGLNEQQKQSEALMEQFKQAAQASVLKAGQELSSKLLEDHKRETKQQRETQEQFTHKTTQQLLEQVTKLGQQFAATDQRSAENAQQMQTVMRALTHPGGAGSMAELGLENSLKKLGLEQGRDFFLQYHAPGEGGSLRPDAVLFLPHDRVMVIDSKASKHLVGLAEAEGTDQEERVLQQLVATVHKHIAALSKKDYSKAVADTLRAENRSFTEMLNVMYLPGDAMIERLRRADPSLHDKAEAQGIILAGPTSLVGLLAIAKQQIGQALQQENHEKIIQLVQEMTDSFATALSHVEGVGKGLQSSAKKFDDFAGSLNSRLLPKLRKLGDYGISGSTNKPLPQSLPRYDMQRRDEIIEGGAEEEAQPRLIKNGAGID